LRPLAGKAKCLPIRTKVICIWERYRLARRRTIKPARGQTRSHFLEERIAEDIINGRLSPGTRLEEQALADRFDTSRTPVREALRRLAATGLIEIRPRRGVIVSTVTRDRLAQMFETMAELEGACARLAAQRMSEDDLARLIALRDEGARIMQTADPDAYALHNRKFHAAIYSGAGNAVLEETAQSVRARLAPFRSAQFHIPGRVIKSASEHAEVVDAIVHRDGDRAYTSMRAHMLTVSDASSVFATRVSV